MAHFHNDHPNHAPHPPAGRRSHEDPASVLDSVGPEDSLNAEMMRLLVETQQLRQEVGGLAPEGGGHHHGRPADGQPGDLAAENARLRRQVEELEQLLDAATNQSQQIWAEQQREYESLIEEKSEVIRTLHQQVQELKSRRHAQPAAPPDAALPGRQELLALKARVDEERRQLEEDEQAMMDQMKQMEMAMSRERVELARQHNEIQRLYRELQHEIEQASRDGSLRDRLLAMQRRHQEQITQGGAAPRRAAPTQTALPPAQEQRQPRRAEGSNGLLQRLFGAK